MSVSHKIRWLPLAAVLAAVSLAGCGEQLDGGATCPALCPNQNIPTRDTVLLGAISVDTSVAGFPPVGTEPFLLLASRGGGAALDTRFVTRFDSLPRYVTSPTVSTDSVEITSVDSASLRMFFDLTSAKLTDTVHVDVYDVDTTAADSSTAALLPLFRADRFLTTVAVPPAGLSDTIVVNLPDSAVLAKVQGNRRLRLGFRATSPADFQLRIYSLESGSGLGPRLRFDPSPDTAIHAIAFSPRSTTPSTEPRLASDRADYTVVVSGSALPPGDAVAVGGLPGRRTYLRFDIPADILDSNTVVRATLSLVQRPNPGLDPGDTLKIFPQVVLASKGIEVGRAVDILSPIAALGLDSLVVTPADSGERTIRMVSLLRRWRTQAQPDEPRAIVLRSSSEGTLPLQAWFFSSEAPVGLRPRLRISYIPRVNFGLP